MPQTSLLSGRTALVTGGAVRLGRAIALRLAQDGADVVIHYATSRDDARRVVLEIESLGRRAVAVEGDFSHDTAGATQAAFEQATARLGPVDLLVNSAAIFEPGTLASTTEDAWDRHFDVNLKAPLWMCREFAARLPPERAGHVVNIIDWRGLRPVPGHLAYTLAKGALVAATRLLAQELAPRIQVNAVAPGAILPPPGEGLEYLDRLRDRIPLRRTGTPDDVADAVVFLASSRFITGEVLCVTGGEQL
jgi:pteridine reductase